nr:VanZ family protein [Streptomyces sp. SID2119]
MVPFGLLGVLATRRPGLVAGFSLLLPATIETTQALAPIGRACDTSDFVANGAGGLAGTVLGALVIVVLRGSPLPRGAARKGLIATGIATALMGAVLYASAGLVVMNHTVAPPATSAQKAAIDQRLRDALGGAYWASDYSVTTTGFEDAATVTAYFGNGMAELSWPDQWDFTVQIMSSTDEPSGVFSVPGAAAGTAAAKRPVGDKEAALIARAYADRFAPWGTRNAKVEVARPDDGGPPGWVVSWRRYEGEVVLPPRFDVRIDEEGRVSELTERKVADPQLPPRARDGGRGVEDLREEFPGEGRRHRGEAGPDTLGPVPGRRMAGGLAAPWPRRRRVPWKRPSTPRTAASMTLRRSPWPGTPRCRDPLCRDPSHQGRTQSRFSLATVNPADR